MKLQKIVELLEEKKLLIEYNIKDISIEYISYNSKDIRKNTLFVCKGFTFKKEYLFDSIKRGVIAYISEEVYDCNISYIKVNDIRKAMAVVANYFYDDDMIKIGVTGTKGKTTTVSFIKNILNHKEGFRTGHISTIDLYTGEREEKSHNTTPESLDLHKYLNEMTNHNLKYVSMEVSSQAVKLDRVYGMNFEVGAFLNIGEDHISDLEHKDFNDYFNCKLGFLKLCNTVVLYRHVDRFEEILDTLEKEGKKIITFGYEKADYIINNIERKENEVSFYLNKEKYVITMKGDFNVINASCAIIIAKILGTEKEDILKGLYETKVLGRMNIFNGLICPVIVDYAHNKISAGALFESLKRDYPDKNIKIVFGCPGDRGVNRRKEMAELSLKYASFVYLTAEDPQTKDVFDICKEIISYMDSYTSYKIIPDRELAIKTAIEEATESDIIAILGKGDETYQIVNYEFVPYKSDIKVVEEMISKVKEV